MGLFDLFRRQPATAKAARVRLEYLRRAQQPGGADAALTGGGYYGTGRAQLDGWDPGVRDADSDIVFDLVRLRAHSRDLARTSPIAAGAIETQLAHIVGTGLTMQARIDHEHLGMTEDQASEWQRTTERWFDLWASSELADYFGQVSFYEAQSVIERSKTESGDTFVLLANVERAGWPFRLALQIIEADRVCNPNGATDNDTLVQGIERTEAGVPMRAHIADRHPGRLLSRMRPTKWTAVPFRGESGRRFLLQHMRRLRPGQTRGVPELAPIIEPLKQMTRYSEAEITAAVNSAALSIFTKMDKEAFEDLFDDEGQAAIIDKAKGWDGSIQAGTAVNLLPGEEIQTAEMNRPNPNFGPFVEQFMVQVGMALCIPYEVLVRRFNSSFSASRAALLDAWRGFKIRRELLVMRVLQPIYEEWLADAVALGIISAPGFFTDALTRAAWCGTSWAGDGPGAIDPEKEARGAQARMDAGLTTLSDEVVAYDGGDWEAKTAQQKREKKARKGLEKPQPGAAAPGGAPTQQEPGQGGDQQQEDAADDGQKDSEQ